MGQQEHEAGGVADKATWEPNQPTSSAAQQRRQSVSDYQSVSGLRGRCVGRFHYIPINI